MPHTKEKLLEFGSSTWTEGLLEHRDREESHTSGREVYHKQGCDSRPGIDVP